MIKKIQVLLMVVIGVQLMYAQRSADFISPDQLFWEAKTMFADKNYAGCMDKITQYKAGLLRMARHDEQQEESDFMLAASAFHQGNSDAGYVLRDFLDTYPQTVHRNELCFMLGSVNLKEKNYELANYWFKQCDLNDLNESAQADYTYRRATLDLHNNQDDVAGQGFSVLHQNSAKYQTASAYSLAYLAFKASDYRKALNQFLELKNDPKLQPDILYCIGVSYYHLGDYQQAVDYLQPLSSALSPADNYMLGTAYFHLKNYASAVFHLHKSNPGSTSEGQSTYLYLGQSYLQLGDKANALRAFESASRMNFNASAKEAATYNYALLLHQNSIAGFGESITVLENFINTYPHSIYSDQVNNALVEVYLNTKNYDTALVSIAKIKNPSTRILAAKQKIEYYLGTVDFANGKYDAAIRSFSKAISEGDYALNEKQLAIYWRGESYFRKNNFTPAAKDYQAFINTGNKTGDLATLAEYNLAYTFFKQKDYATARPHFQTFINKKPNNNDRLADAYIRLGDCNFLARQYKEAENAYTQAVKIQPSMGDYASFQKAYVLGLQKDYQGKIAQLNQLIAQYPHSPYMAEGMFEKGRACVMLNNSASAIETFQTLMSSYPNSSWARSAGLQIGLLHYNANQPEQAAAAYKNVIAKYPGSEEAKEALQDLKSVYFDANDFSGYNDYVATLDDKTLAAENRPFTEEAIGQKADRLYNNKDYNDALILYEQLQAQATNKTNQTLGALGVIRSAVQVNNHHKVVSAVTNLLQDNTLNPETVTEITYYRAKAALNLGNHSQAESDLKALAQDTRIAQGAESNYLLAKFYFDNQNTSEAKTIIQDYIQQGTPHAYWLAKSFILLSDMYVAENDRLQARQYLESLQENYKNTKDDIHSTIKERLNKLK